MILKIENLSAVINHRLILNNISFTSEDKGVLAIIGPSGSGKTTLLRCIAGLQEYSGNIYFNHQISQQQKNIGLVTQDFSLFTHLTVFKNIAYPLKIRKLPLTAVDAIINDFGLQNIKNKYPTEISGGEAQRVSLARALVYQPRLLLLDEPFSQLDAILRFDLITWLKKILSEQKITTLFVTHDIKEAKFISNKILLLDHGQITATGYDHPLIQSFLNKSL
jgi:ABC-type sulfate/molybdate transport systems ATPase subunit